MEEFSGYFYLTETHCKEAWIFLLLVPISVEVSIISDSEVFIG